MSSESAVKTLHPAGSSASTMQAMSAMMNLTIGEDGRIRLPGAPGVMTVDTYLPLVHLYTATMEAARVLAKARQKLTTVDHIDVQEPLTPLEESRLSPGLLYKREDKTITKAYKVRGAVTAMAKAMEAGHRGGFLAVSTGNHALGVLTAAELLEAPSVTVVVPSNTSTSKRDRLEAKAEWMARKGFDAKIVEYGSTFDEARDAVERFDKSLYFIDPYSNPWVVAGQGTVGLEIYRQLRPYVAQTPSATIDVICPVGGGGLLSGVGTALKLSAAWDPSFRQSQINLIGLRLESMDSPLGDAIRVAEVEARNQERLDAWGAEFSTISDATMQAGVNLVEADTGTRVEGPCGATRVVADAHRRGDMSNRLQVCIISGANLTSNA